jgi:hypothetical protein
MGLRPLNMEIENGLATIYNFLRGLIWSLLLEQIGVKSRYKEYGCKA